MHVVSLNLLNRDVRVGCLYNYNYAEILPGTLEIPREDIELLEYTDPLPVDKTITTDTSEKGRLSCIGINQHLRRQLEDQKFEMNRLWFNSYLNDEAFDSCNNNEVHIIAYLKFARRGECLNDDFISSKIWQYHDNDHGGTHLVQEVEYGAEFVLWIRKPIDTLKETKQAVEQTMCIALNNYLDNLFNRTSSLPILIDKAFDTVTCSFRSSICNGGLNNGKFQDCIRMIQELANMEENDRQSIWHPVGIRLCPIPTTIEMEVYLDWCQDIVFDIKQRNQWVEHQCHQLIKSPLLDRIPILKKALIEFKKLLKPMASTMNDIVEELGYNYYPPDERYSNADPYKNLLSCAFHWLRQWDEDVEKMKFFLEGNSLPVLDLRSIQESIKEDRDFKRTKIFVIHFSCITTDLKKRFKNWVRYPRKGLDVFNFEMSGETEWERISKEFQVFLNEALYSMDNDVDYAVGILSPKSSYKEGSVFTVGYEDILRAVKCITPSDTPVANNSPLASSEGSQDTEEVCDVDMI